MLTPDRPDTAPSPIGLSPIGDLLDGAAADAGGTLAPLARALDACSADVRPVEGETQVPLDTASGRVLAAPLTAPIALPPFDRSAMDGYALCPAGSDGAERFRVEAHIAAGDDPAAAPALWPGKAARILTGAPVPAGADRVVPQEHVIRDGPLLHVPTLPALGANIRRRAEDLARGMPVLEAGRLLTPRDVALIAALGIDRIGVRRRVRVALLSTGSELREPGRALAPGRVYNSNRAMLRALADHPATDILDLGSIPDDPARIEAAFRHAADVADLVLTTGGVSVGDEDHVGRLMTRLGGRLRVERAAVKPGKPVLIGEIGEVPLVGLPGNPVAAFVTYVLLARPLIARRAGAEPRPVLVLHAESTFAHERKPGRAELVPVTLEPASPHPRLHRPAMVGAAKLTALASADGLALITPDRGPIRPGDSLGFVSFAETATF